MPDEIQAIEAEIQTAAHAEVSELKAIDKHVPSHHEIQVAAYGLWEACITANGVDYGPWYWWFTALWHAGIISHEPLPPPVE